MKRGLWGGGGGFMWYWLVCPLLYFYCYFCYLTHHCCIFVFMFGGPTRSLCLCLVGLHIFFFVPFLRFFNQLMLHTVVVLTLCIFMYLMISQLPWEPWVFFFGGVACTLQDRVGRRYRVSCSSYCFPNVDWPVKRYSVIKPDFFFIRF